VNAAPSSTPWLSKQEAAERARVSLAQLDRAIASGELRTKKVGRRVILHVDWVDAWLASPEEAGVA
jgi:excisionase family DNA binding protein